VSRHEGDRIWHSTLNKGTNTLALNLIIQTYPHVHDPP